MAATPKGPHNPRAWVPFSRAELQAASSMPPATAGEAGEERLRADLEVMVEAAVRRQLADVEARLLRTLEERQCGNHQLALPKVCESSTASSPDPALEATGSPSSASRGERTELRKIEEATPSQFEFSHSTWDASMLIGIDAVGAWESVMLVVLVLLVMVVALVFCGIILTNFTEPRFTDTDISQLRSWRLNTAHFYAEVDKLTGVTLASRVCNLDRGLATSAEQVATVSAIRSYLPKDQSWLTSGPAMCMTALVLWYLTIMKELAHLIRCMRGFLLLPTDVDGTVIRGSDITLLSVSRVRKAWVIVATLLRLGVLWVLSYAGTLYIVYTVEVRDLLLNCVALEVVLNIDELAFEGLTSSKLQSKISMMQPLPIRRHTSIVGRMWGAVALSMVGTALVLAGTQVLAPYMERLQLVEQVLCGGEQDFAVYVMDEVGVPIMSFTPPFNESEQRAVFSQQGIREAINSSEQHESLRSVFALVTEQPQFHQFKSFLANSDGYPGPDMDDLVDIAVPSDTGETQAYLARLRNLLQDQGDVTCSDLPGNPKCYGYDSVSSAVRFLCPVSCGCGSLLGGVIMDTNAYCPDGGVDSISTLVEELPCADNTSAMQEIYAVRYDHGAHVADLSCQTIADEEAWRCETTSVAAACPISCGCASHGYLFCPPSCSQR